MPRLIRAVSLALCLLPAPAFAIDNAWVRVSRDAAPCAAAAAPDCGFRVLVALADLELRAGAALHRLVRGDIAVFGPGQDYAAPAAGSYFEVAIKPGHPPALSPAELIAAEKNAPLYDGEEFFVFEERLAPGDTRARHSHSQRVVIQLNRARLQQWPDGAPELFVETVPERPSFSPPVIHTVKNVGDVPLRGIVIEFKPGR
ncbi:MAG TPA: hypothetical protein VIA64_05215 [Burkholderiales bacterium]|jgi:hypothetical protein